MERRVTPAEIADLAWDFLRSDYTGKNYWHWSLDRRVDAYLLRSGRIDIINDGVHELMQQIMTNISRARRDGHLP